MKCENCCYYGYSEGVTYEHCLFTEIRGEYEVAPCDDPDFDDDREELDGYGY